MQTQQTQKTLRSTNSETKTLRDETWDAVIAELVENGKFKLDDLPFSSEERHTIRRSLKAMEDSGWVQRDTPNSSIWRIGPRSKALLDVSEDTLCEAIN